MNSHCHEKVNIFKYVVIYGYNDFGKYYKEDISYLT